MNRLRHCLLSSAVCLAVVQASPPAAAAFEYDAEFFAQGGLFMVDAQAAYLEGITGAGIVVGVVDSGLFLGHPEFLGATIAGYNAIDGSDDVTDNDGHGTHVAGIVGARRDGTGMQGIAPGATILPIKLMDEDDDEDDDLDEDAAAAKQAELERYFNEVAARAYRAAIERGAHIVNGSIGLNEEDAPPGYLRRTMIDLTAEAFAEIFPDFLEAMREVAAADVITVFTTGNESERNADILAGLPYLYPELTGTWLAVGAIGLQGEQPYYSSACGLAATWCLWAPGGGDDDDNEGILSADHEGGYVRFSGTSMAAPHVSGALALLMQRFPELTPQQVVQLLLLTATDIGDAGVDPTFGHGFMNVERAIRGPTIAAWETLTVDAGADGTMVYTLPLDGDGGVVKTGDGRVVFAGVNGYGGTTTVQGGSFYVNGSVAGAVTVEAGATLRGTGVIGGPTTIDGTLAPGASPGTLAVAAPAVLGPGATLSVEIDGPGTGDGAGNYSRLLVTGAGNGFAADGTIEPVLRGISDAANNDFTPALGQGFAVVEAEGGIAGAFATIAQPPAGLPAGTRFDVVYGTRTVSLLVTPSSYADLAAAGVERTPNRAAVGAALESVRPAAAERAGGDTGALFDALAPLSAGGTAGALDGLAGTVHAAGVGGAAAADRAFGAVVGRRMARLRDGGGAAFAAGPTDVQFASAGGVALPSAAAVAGPAAGSAGKSNGWARALVSSGSVRGDGNAAGWDSTGGLGAVGVDSRVSPDLLVGAALAFGRTVATAEGGGDEVRVDGYRMGVYGSWAPGTVFLDLQLGASADDYASTRDVVVGGLARRASGDAAGYTLSGSATVGWGFRAGETLIEPSAGLDLARLYRGSFTETGAGGLGLSVESESMAVARSRLGLRVAHGIDAGTLRVEPEVRAGWAHDWADTAAESRARLGLGGDAFTVVGADPGRDMLTLGIGVSAVGEGGLRAFVDYEFDARSRATGHTVSGGVRWAW